jgi:hypothetical protein
LTWINWYEHLSRYSRFGGGGGGGGGKGGGGGGQAHTPTEADDSLQSVQYGSVLDLLSEGEIEGIEGGVKGIYLDGTPIQSSTGTLTILLATPLSPVTAHKRKLIFQHKRH